MGVELAIQLAIQAMNRLIDQPVNTETSVALYKQAIAVLAQRLQMMKAAEEQASRSQQAAGPKGNPSGSKSDEGDH